MARLKRQCLANTTHHVMQRGNNKRDCFLVEEDAVNYVAWLKKYSVQHQVSIHAWVLMKNHVHLLLTPKDDDGVSNMMQDLGRRYVRYFNCRHQYTGTLWEGRFKNCWIDSDEYLLQCYRYIECNPVRAGIVSHPSEYKWSSYRINTSAIESDLCTPHELYVRLGKSPNDRQKAYKSIVDELISERSLSVIRDGLRFGSVLSAELDHRKRE